MKRFEFDLENAHGLHARPAGLMVETCSTFNSDINIYKGDVKVNGKSMLGVLMLAASKGDALAIEIEGDDELKALDAIKTLINSHFDE
ncbi:MAG TPA: phosphocarrier protein HPr [Clostridiales bacterium UBA8960]|jgi:phosphocarrier protein|nr:phosphocarrier protein HPr [Clostridiales bacterium UBA8960]